MNNIKIDKCKECGKKYYDAFNIIPIEQTGLCLDCLEAHKIQVDGQLKEFDVHGVINLTGETRKERILAIDGFNAKKIFAEGYPDCQLIISCEEVED